MLDCLDTLQHDVVGRTQAIPRYYHITVCEICILVMSSDETTAISAISLGT